MLALVAHHDGRPGVLAAGQHAAGGDVRVAEQLEGHEAVVRGGFRVVDDRPELGQMAGPQQVRDVVERGPGDRAQHVGLHLQDVAAAEPQGRDAVGGQLAVGRVVRPELEEWLIMELGRHRSGRDLTPAP